MLLSALELAPVLVLELVPELAPELVPVLVPELALRLIMELPMLLMLSLWLASSLERESSLVSRRVRCRTFSELACRVLSTLT